MTDELAPHLAHPPRPAVASGARYWTGLCFAEPVGLRPLRLDVSVPAGPGPHPVVLWVHGGGFFFGDRVSMPPTLGRHELRDASLAAGVAFATLDYRLAMEAHFPAAIHDVKSALRYLRYHARALGIDASRVGIGGESAGGHLATLAALTGATGALEGDVGVTEGTSEVAVCVDWYGVTDLSTMPRTGAQAEWLAPLGYENFEDGFLGFNASVDIEAARAASPVGHVTALAPPTLLLHGDADRAVPLSQSETLASLLASAGASATLEVVEGVDHCFIGIEDMGPIVARTIGFFAQHLLR